MPGKISKYILLGLALFIFSCGDQTNQEATERITDLLSKADELQPQSEAYYHLADSAYRIALRINSLDSKLIEKSLVYLGSHFLEKYDYEDALEKYKLVAKFHGDSPPSAILGDAYHGIGRLYYRMDKDSLSVEYFKKAAAIRSSVGDSVGLGTSLNNTGFVFWANSRFDSALVYFEKALVIREKQSNKENLLSTLNNIGTIYYQWSIYDKALDNYRRVLELSKAASDTSNESNVLSNIGLVYLKTQQPGSAREYFREALKYAAMIDDQNRIGYALTNLASSFLESNVDSALFYYKKSLQVYKDIGFIGGQLLAIEGTGRCYSKSNRLKEAKEQFEEVVRLASEEKILLRKAYGLHYLGTIENKFGKISKAIKLFKQSNDLANEISVKEIQVDNYKYLSEIYEKTGNITKAYRATKSYLTYKNELENKEIHRRLAASKKQFETERINRMMEAARYENEKQGIVLIFSIALIILLVVTLAVLYRIHLKRVKAHKLLEERNALIESQKEELFQVNVGLRELTKTKDKFYSIIAHDLKNPFISLCGYTEILKNEFHELSDKEKIEYISELETVTRKTYGLLENLLDLSSQKSGKMVFKPELFNLRNNSVQVIEIARSQAKSKGVKIINKISPDIEVHADKSMIETVIRNLLTNAVKFSHTGGDVKLDASEKEEEVTVLVEDNGIGMDEQTVKNILEDNAILSTRGTNDEKGSGLGIEICKEFVKSNKGKFSVESESGKGSIFYFTLPKTSDSNSVLTS